MTKRHPLYLMFLFVFVVSMAILSSCTSADHKREIVVMWETDNTDAVYQKWSEILEGELERQGIDANLHYQYNNIGMTQEKFEISELSELVMSLTNQGRKPDLILAHGNYPEWLLAINKDPLVSSIPAICFGLKSEHFLPRMDTLLSRRDYPFRPRVQIIDTLALKENLDLADYIQNLPGMIVAHRQYLHRSQTHRFITLLDRDASWIDSLAVEDLDYQNKTLDPQIYFNNIMNQTTSEVLNAENDKGKIVYSIYSLTHPETNVRLTNSGHNVNTTWAFYPQLNPNFFISAKHDNVSRQLTEGADFLPFYTMVGEDFLANDSCVGGFFTPAEVLLSEAVSASKRVLDGEKVDSIVKLYHTKSLNINYDILRSRGIGIDLMPPSANLYNVTLYDRKPVLATILLVFCIALAIAFVVVVVLYSSRQLSVLYGNRKAIRHQAMRQIKNRELLKMVFDTCKVILWDEQCDDTSRLLSRISTDEYSRKQLKSFLSESNVGSYSHQFYGSLDHQPISWYEIRMKVTRDGKDKPLHRGFIVNIEKQKELEAMTVETNRLIANTQVREGFISAMNHEIRTPLHAVVGFAIELADHGDLLNAEETDSFGHIIESNAVALRKIINDILTVTLIGHSNFAFHNKPCLMSRLFVPDLWEDAQKVMKWNSNKLVLDIPDSDVWIQTEPSMFAVVIDNLLLNASKFSPKGSTITLGWRPTSKDGNVEIWVKDEGKGIDSQYHELVFERFFKIDSFHPGGGLGLFICKTYVSLMGGTIAIDSQEGCGSTFTIRL